ncbi:MAG: MarR family transcriptional regulator [Nitrososphaerota archaeon]|nr:MarR family transcriptional regulator [Nitrososphaerota archaeon]
MAALGPRPSGGKQQEREDQIGAPWTLVRKVYVLLRQRRKTVLSRSGLTHSQYQTLELCSRGAVTAKTIAETLGLTPGGVTDLVDRLEDKGWVERAKHPEDRRAVLVRLTKEGRQFHGAVHETLAVSFRGVFQQIRAEDRKALAQGLTALAKILEATPSES